MGNDGSSYRVEWYFVPGTVPTLDNVRRFRSLNYSYPHTPPGLLGEDGSRSWRDGSTPTYVGLDAQPTHSNPIAGSLAWWQNGSPGPGSGGLRFDGSRGFTNILGPAIFPPFSGNPGPATLTWTGGPIAPGSFTPNLEYIFIGTGFRLAWAFWAEERSSPPMLWGCGGGPVLWWFNGTGGPEFPLKCTHFDGVKTSTWVDGGYGVTTGTFTLTAP